MDFVVKLYMVSGGRLLEDDEIRFTKEVDEEFEISVREENEELGMLVHEVE